MSERGPRVDAAVIHHRRNEHGRVCDVPGTVSASHGDSSTTSAKLDASMLCHRAAYAGADESAPTEERARRFSSTAAWRCTNFGADNKTIAVAAFADVAMTLRMGPGYGRGAWAACKRPHAMAAIKSREGSWLGEPQM